MKKYKSLEVITHRDIKAKDKRGGSQHHQQAYPNDKFIDGGWGESCSCSDKVDQCTDTCILSMMEDRGHKIHSK